MQRNAYSPKSAYSILAAVLFFGVYMAVHQMRSSGTFPPSAASGSHTYESHPMAASDEDGIAVYFSPHGGCTAAIVNEIQSAKSTIDMQAYSFTSAEIEHALADARARGVHIRAIIDRQASSETGSRAEDLPQDHIEAWTDGDHPIAHNKIIIIDAQTVITGSFNFTHQAENSNAENLVIITGHPSIAAAYEKNFELHLSHSQRLGAGESRNSRAR